MFHRKNFRAVISFRLVQFRFTHWFVYLNCRQISEPLRRCGLRHYDECDRSDRRGNFEIFCGNGVHARRRFHDIGRSEAYKCNAEHFLAKSHQTCQSVPTVDQLGFGRWSGRWRPFSSELCDANEQGKRNWKFAWVSAKVSRKNLLSHNAFGGLWRQISSIMANHCHQFLKMKLFLSMQLVVETLEHGSLLIVAYMFKLKEIYLF